jgi:isopentenyl diphosphate isomerase/L-lactate dehydrogenase-like FMN-dependent dehydrogenase
MININLTGMWHAAKAAIPHLKTAIRFAPQVVRRPRWLLSYAQTAHLPDLTVPNMTGQGQAPPTFFGAYRQGMASPLPTWDDVWWLAEQWGGPFMVKGVTRVDDARQAADAGVTAISVSNHGGNDLDGTPTTIRVLPAIAVAVGNQLEIVLDGVSAAAGT